VLFELTLALLVILPADSIIPSTLKLPVILAILLMLKLLAVTLPLLNVFQDKLLKVASPMFGVVRFALVLTTIFPPTISVVTPSTLALIEVPVMLIPEPAEYDPAALNCVKVKLSVPIMTSPVGKVIT